MVETVVRTVRASVPLTESGPRGDTSACAAGRRRLVSVAGLTRPSWWLRWPRWRSWIYRWPPLRRSRRPFSGEDL